MVQTPASPAASRSRVALLFLGGLLIAFGLPALDVGTLAAPGEDVTARVIRQLIWLGTGLLLLLWVLLVERRPPASIGLKRPGWGTLLWGVLGAAALIASFMVCYALVLPALGMTPDMDGAGRILKYPYWLQLMIFACAAIVEEIIYRGYLIERIGDLTSSRWLGFAVSVVVFTAAHMSGWGTSQLIVVAAGAVIMGLLYLWKRDLVMVMIAHFLADVVGFALASQAAAA